MKGILIEPGKGPVVTTLPDTLQGIEAWLGGHADQKYFSRTPAILMHSAAGREPNRIWRGEVLCGTLLCYGWRGGRLQPLYDYLYLQMRTASEEIHRYQYHWQPSVWLCTRP